LVLPLLLLVKLVAFWLAVVNRIARLGTVCLANF
jgi:hypothetical protein